MKDALMDLGISYLLTAIKNPKKKATIRSVVLKVFKVTWQHFGSDQDFKDVVGVE